MPIKTEVDFFVQQIKNNSRLVWVKELLLAIFSMLSMYLYIFFFFSSSYPWIGNLYENIFTIHYGMVAFNKRSAYMKKNVNKRRMEERKKEKEETCNNNFNEKKY